MMSKSILFNLLQGCFWLIFFIIQSIRYNSALFLLGLPGALLFLVWALYLHLKRTEKGRACLEKLHLCSRKN